MKEPILARRQASRFGGIYLCIITTSLAAGVMNAQGTNVSVDTAKEVNILTNNSLGVPALMYSGDSFSPSVIPYLRVAGATTMRYPGNHGVADLYHWESRSLTSYKGAEKPYVAPESDFGRFAETADKLGGATVVVNYGSNGTGDGGAEPAEAAAWVAYANGDPGDERPLGKDASGIDWKTVGFWASVRGGEKLGIDDGYNFLRLGHPKSMHIKLWQIGDQIYNNGFYGGDHAGNPDLHGPAPAAIKDFAKLRKEPKVSPTTFAANLLEFTKAMKAVDSSIQVGVALPTPLDGENAYPDFASTVLKKACSALDFVTLEWTPTALLPPNYKVLDEAQTFLSSREQIGSILNSVLGEYKEGCPKNHLPRIAFSTAAVPSWAKPDHPAFTALWLADIYSMLIEAGSPNVNWPEVYGSSMISTDHKTFGPAYYGMEMIHAIARAPGDAFVAAASTNPKLAVHATKRRDGMVGLMFVNEDLAPISAHVNVSGAALNASGRRLDYGSAQQDSNAPVATSDMVGLGKEFNITVPGYTISVLLVPIAK